MLSGKERDRLKVLHEVQEGHLRQRAAAGQLGISDREGRRLLVRIEVEGDGGVVHRLRGKASNRRLPEGLRSRVLKLVKANYRDFGPTLACEYLAKDNAVTMSKETLRQWLMAAGLRGGETPAHRGGARVAAAPELSGRVSSMGHLGARLAGRPGTEAVPGGHDR